METVERDTKEELMKNLISNKAYKELKEELLIELLNNKSLRDKMCSTLLKHLVICNKCGNIFHKENTKIAEHDGKNYCFTCYYGKEV